MTYCCYYLVKTAFLTEFFFLRELRANTVWNQTDDVYNPREACVGLLICNPSGLEPSYKSYKPQRDDSNSVAEGALLMTPKCAILFLYCRFFWIQQYIIHYNHQHCGCRRYREGHLLTARLVVRSLSVPLCVCVSPLNLFLMNYSFLWISCVHPHLKKSWKQLCCDWIQMFD